MTPIAVSSTSTALLHTKQTRLVGLIFKRLFKLYVNLGNESTQIQATNMQASAVDKTVNGNPTPTRPPHMTLINSKTSSSSKYEHQQALSSAASMLNTPGGMAAGGMSQIESPLLNSVRNPLSVPLNQESASTAGASDPPTSKEKAPFARTSHNPSSSNTDDNALLASRRVDPSTVRQVFYFDTLAFAKKLESKGFTREQAEGCAESLVEIINTTLDHQGRHMVTKPQQEIAVQQLLSEIVSVKKDMTLLQKSEFSSLKTETEKMSIELSQIQSHVNDQILKLKGQFSLDINLERGRAIEAHAENEKKLQQLHNKIETEIANLKTIFEVYRNDVFKYAGGTVLAVGSLILGVLRLWQ
nr:mitochondrial calcium uniporter regulator 1 [Biomphalaria glabrata]KAI8762352.1 mitochondrial calcium uniporter regulator 1 [Biomphalaria glabrata]